MAFLPWHFPMPRQFFIKFLEEVMENRNENLKKLVVSAVMIAIGTVLSLDAFKFGGLWLFGGGVTFCSMLPLVMVSYIYGCRWGVFTAFAYSLIQLVLGVDNVQYATSALMAAAIVLLDYIVAYTVIGFAGMFKNKIKNQTVAIVAGIWVTFFARFICHFITGWIIWEALWPNEFGMLSPVYSLYYNGSYMLPEAIITSVAAAILMKMAPKLFSGKI